MPLPPARAALVWCLLIGLVSVPAVQAQEQKPEPPPPQSPGLINEPPIMQKAVDFAGERLVATPGMPKDGFYPEFGYMITGSGWISAGPGYRHKFLDDRLYAETSAAISWRAYKMVQARVEYHAVGEDTLTFGAQEMWNDLTQIHYYGLGPDSSKSDKGAYRLQDFDTIGWVRYNLKPVVLSGTVGYLNAPTISSPAGPFKRGYEDARTLFTPAQAPGLESIGYVHATVSAAVDNRDLPGHPTRGGMYRAGFSEYSARDNGQFTFQRYEAEALQFVPLGPRNWTLALHGWLVGSDTAADGSVPVYLMPSLGGHNTLRGYVDYRFHDRDMLLASAESRWALMQDLDIALFGDAGNVAPRVSDLDLSKTSVGVGLRLHNRYGTFCRLDFAHSKEGWGLYFKLDDVFAVSHLSRQVATAPFVP